MITATLLIDLTHQTCNHDRGHDDWACDKRLIYRLEDVPDGARVIVDLGPRHGFGEFVVDWLSRHDARLSIEVQGQDSDAVARLVRRARNHDAWRVSE